MENSIKDSLADAMRDIDFDSGNVDLMPSSPEPAADSAADPAPDLNTESKPAAKSAPESATKSSTKSLPGRDASGRFVKGSKPTADELVDDTTTLAEEINEEVAHEPEVNSEAPPKVIPPTPSGFGKHQDLWAKLNDPDVQLTNDDKHAVLEFYKTREAEMLKGIGHYKDIATKSAYLHKAIEHHIPRLMQEGIDPATFVSNLANAHMKLSSGNPQEKIETFNYLMQAYGVQFNQQGQIAPMDYHTQAMMDQLKTMQGQIQNFENIRLQEQENAIQLELRAIESDRTNFPLFHEAVPGMIHLLENDQAKTYEEAYRKAIRLDDDLWSKHTAGQLQSPVQPKQEQILKAKKAAVSVSNQAPRAEAPRQQKPAPIVRSRTNSRSIEDSLRAAMA